MERHPFVNPSTRANVKRLLHGLIWLFSALAGLAFWFGGGVIHAVAGTDRTLAEIEGIALAALSGILAITAKGIEDHLDVGEADPHGPKSLGEVLRN